MSPLEHATALVNEWLEGEHGYQFGKNLRTHNANPSASIAYIMSKELSNKWHRSRLFRSAHETSSDDGLYLQAGQHVLKAVGAARGALVWDAVSQGRTIQRASTASFSVLQSYFDQVATNPERLPALDLLDSPLEEAIYPASTTPIEGQYQIIPVYTALAGHAINHLLVQADESGVMSLPRPGVASGDIEPWKNIIVHTEHI